MAWVAGGWNSGSRKNLFASFLLSHHILLQAGGLLRSPPAAPARCIFGIKEPTK
jgi:hypothetical protein